MAFSQPLSGSFDKGQTAMLCQLCENDPKLKWKCLECGLMMCQRCRDKVHPKFPSAENHTIIDIKEVGQYQIDSAPKPDLTKLKCKEHSGQNCCFYCLTCETLVCQTCVIKSHNRHEFTEIREEYEIKCQKIIDETKEIEKGMHVLKVSEAKLKKVKSTEQSNYEKVKQDILDYENALINEIKQHTNKLLKLLDSKWGVLSNHIDCEMNRLKKEQENLYEHQTQTEQLLNPEMAENLFYEKKSLRQRKSNIIPINSTINGIPQLTHADKTKISQILGKLNDSSLSINTELKVKSQFIPEIESITTVLSCPDGGLWLCDRFVGIIYKVEPKVGKLIVVPAIILKVYDAALLPSGDLLMSTSESSNLKVIRNAPSGSTDVQDTVYSVSPLLPRALHITCDNKIIVGTRKPGPAFPASLPRKVIIMDQYGHHEKVFQYEGNDQPLFTIPAHISSNSQSRIAVVDIVSDDGTGRVVVLDNDGKVRNIYIGHSDVNNEDNPFTPRGITSTPSDNFVVTDIANHTIHILNSEGEIITLNNTEEMGILLPLSLSFSTTGQLYIGCNTYEDGDTNAKLYEIDNFLF